jgi:GntR family transcriptional regulator
LELNPEDRVIKLIRIRNVEEKPFFWTKFFLPEKLCPDLLDEDLENQSLYEVLKLKYGLVAASASRTIETVIASSRSKNYLGVMHGVPN